MIAMDRLFDQTEKSGLSVPERIKQAYMGAFNATETIATQALESIGLSSERMGEIFTSTSDNVLSSMLGIQQSGEDTAQILVGNFNDARNNIAGSFEGLSLGNIAPISVNINPVVSEQGQQDLQGLIQELRAQNEELSLLRSQGHVGTG